METHRRAGPGRARRDRPAGQGRARLRMRASRARDHAGTRGRRQREGERGRGAADATCWTATRSRRRRCWRLYRRRWGIEQVFQQVTETFALAHLIGCEPQGGAPAVRLLPAAVQPGAADQGVRRRRRPRAGAARCRRSTCSRTSAKNWRRGRTTPTARGPAASRRATDASASAASCSQARGTRSATPRRRTTSRAPSVHPERLHGGHSSVQRLLEGKALVVRS